jgi:hypothetical protein
LAGVERLQGILLAACGSKRLRLQEARVAEEQERLDEARFLFIAVLGRLARELVETDGKEYDTG